MKAQPPAVTPLGLRPGVRGGEVLQYGHYRVMKGLSFSSVSVPGVGGRRLTVCSAHPRGPLPSDQAAPVLIIGGWGWSPASQLRRASVYHFLGGLLLQGNVR